MSVTALSLPKGKGSSFWRLEARGRVCRGELKEVQGPGELGGRSDEGHGWREAGSPGQEGPWRQVDLPKGREEHLKSLEEGGYVPKMGTSRG